MKKLLSFVGLLAFCSLAVANSNVNNPVANPEAIVVEGNARFTVLTDRMIRMEWEENGGFEDRASLAIVNRNLPVPQFTAKKNGNVLTIKTKYLTLTYNPAASSVATASSKATAASVATSSTAASEATATVATAATVATSSTAATVATSSTAASEATATAASTATEATSSTASPAGKFTKDNLQVCFKMGGKMVKWVPGMEESGNLRGTVRTLDRIGGRASKTALNFRTRGKDQHWEPMEMENGVLSRDGWTIVDESERHLLEKNDSDWGEAIIERPEGNRQDLYIFAYAHDYKAALRDFTKVAGNIPLPPKYTLGYWWSRYWAYTDQELMDIANEIRSREIPMDVFVVDMDWHETWHDLDKRIGHDVFGQRQGWTGYTWNGDLFSDPEGFLNDLHALDLKVSLNLHPASGIRPLEACYNDFVKDYLSRTDDYDGPKDYVYTDEPYIFKGVAKSGAIKGHRASVPFRLEQQAWADAYFETVIRPIEKIGVDFWWLDWQQWIESRYTKGLSNTFLCNWAFWNDMARQGKSKGPQANRPLIYHRWGGLGSHRYQLGFSGDTYDNWEMLGALPYFTATASNVCYGYWGHDIGGHMQVKKHNTDPEMYTRWLQFGVFTPIFKTHSTNTTAKGIGLERKIWAYPDHYEFMKAAIDLRYALTPYIYTAAREATNTGISICRPMYYYYPEAAQAYDMDQEYLFGNDILATVIDTPAGEDGKAARKMWFPAGNDWYDMAAHTMRKGGTTQTLKYTIDQNPWFVRAGAVIPMAPEGIQNLQNASNSDFRLLVVPGSAAFSTSLYEDDGISQAYTSDFATTKISKKCSGGKTTITIAAREGSFKGAAQSRRITVEAEGVKKVPARITVNGAALGADAAQAKDGKVVITLPEISVNETITLIF